MKENYNSVFMGKIMFFWLTLAYLLRLVKEDEIVSVTDIDTDLNL